MRLLANMIRPSPSSESCAQRWQISPTVTVSTLHHHNAVGVGDDDVTREYDDSGDCDWWCSRPGPRLSGPAGTGRANTGIPHSAGPSASRTAASMTKPPTPSLGADADQVFDECPGPISEPVDDNDVAGCARSRGSNPGPRSGVEEDDGSICPGGFATSSCWWWAAVARCGLCAGSERSVTAPRSGICARSSFVRGRSDCCGESGDLCAGRAEGGRCRRSRHVDHGSGIPRRLKVFPCPATSS
jgi:hypothetical protein